MTSRIQPLEMSARPLDAHRSRTPRCQIARQQKKESNMPSERLMKHLFLALLGGVIAAATAASAQTAPPAFVSAIGDNTNVVFVENHIVIDRP